MLTPRHYTALFGTLLTHISVACVAGFAQTEPISALNETGFRTELNRLENICDRVDLPAQVIGTITVVGIPEPSSAALVVLGAIGFGVRRRR